MTACTRLSVPASGASFVSTVNRIEPIHIASPPFQPAAFLSSCPIRRRRLGAYHPPSVLLGTCLSRARDHRLKSKTALLTDLLKAEGRVASAATGRAAEQDDRTQTIVLCDRKAEAPSLEDAAAIELESWSTRSLEKNLVRLRVLLHHEVAADGDLLIFELASRKGERPDGVCLWFVGCGTGPQQDSQ